MRRIFLSFTVVISTLLLSGCSFFADFVLVNESEKVLTVKYHLQRTEKIPFVSVKAKVLTVEEFRADPREWRDFPSHRILVSEDFQSARVILNPGEVLLLVSDDIRDIADEPAYKSGIKMLSIDSESGSIKYEGDQVFQRFEPGRVAWFPGAPTLYTLTYK